MALGVGGDPHFPWVKVETVQAVQNLVGGLLSFQIPLDFLGSRESYF